MEEQGIIKNYYEQLVMDSIQNTLLDEGKIDDENMFNDIACIALNQLPLRYIRYSIDTAFYLSGEERTKMDGDVKSAVHKAFEIVSMKPRR